MASTLKRKWVDTLTAEQRKDYELFQAKLSKPKYAQVWQQAKNYRRLERQHDQAYASLMQRKAYYKTWLRVLGPDVDEYEVIPLFSDRLQVWALYAALDQSEFDIRIRIELEHVKHGIYERTYSVTGDVRDVMETCTSYAYCNGEVYEQDLNRKGANPKQLEDAKEVLEVDFLDPDVPKDQAFLKRCLALACDANFRHMIDTDFYDFETDVASPWITGLDQLGL